MYIFFSRKQVLIHRLTVISGDKSVFPGGISST